VEDRLPTVTVATSTTIGRLHLVESRKLMEGITHLIIVQGKVDRFTFNTENAFPHSKLVFVDGVGVANSRNEALRRCESDILLFSDDDAPIVPGGITSLQRAFRDCPGLDFLLLRSVNESGELRKQYPKSGSRATMRNTGRMGTIEIAVRPTRVRNSGVQFDPAFGAGSGNPVGDEYLFITDMLKKSLKGRHCSVVIATHPDISSGLRASNAHKESHRQVFRKVYPRTHFFWFFLARARSLMISKLQRRWG